MTVHMYTVARMFIVDGASIQIGVEADGAKEAFAAMLKAADEIGAAPRPVDFPEGGKAQLADEKAKRTRRTKEQIEADAQRAATSAAPIHPATPATPATPAAPYQPHVAASVAPALPITPAFAPPGPPPTGAPPVAMTEAPPFVAGPPSVAMSPVPAPVDPAVEARASVEGAITSLMNSIPKSWRPSIQSQLIGLCPPLGGQIDDLTMAQSVEAAAVIAKFRATCDAAPR